MTNEAHHEGEACLGLCVGLPGRRPRHSPNRGACRTRPRSLEFSCRTQDNASLRWCQPRLGLAFTAISLPHLAAIERQVLLLVETEGLPIDPQPYMTYATALWDSASLVRASPSRPHNPPLPKPMRLHWPQVLGVQPAPPEIFAPFP